MSRERPTLAPSPEVNEDALVDVCRIEVSSAILIVSPPMNDKINVQADQAMQIGQQIAKDGGG